MSLIACEGRSNQPWARQESSHSLNASQSYPFKFRSLTRAVEKYPEGHIRINPSSIKYSGQLRNSLFFTLSQTLGKKTLPWGQFPDLQQPMVTHHITSQVICDHFRREIKLLAKHPLSNLSGQYFHLACTKDISLNIHKAETDQRKVITGLCVLTVSGGFSPTSSFTCSLIKSDLGWNSSAVMWPNQDVCLFSHIRTFHSSHGSCLEIIRTLMPALDPY